MVCVKHFYVLAITLLWVPSATAAGFSTGSDCHPTPGGPIAAATLAVVRISGDRRGPFFLPNPVFGSGVLVGDDGLVVTSAHVVAGAANVTFSGPGLAPVASTTVLVDPSADVALLRIPLGTPYCLPPSSGKPTQVGDTVFAIGFPFGAAKATIAKGSLTALPPPQTEIASVVGLLRTDAAIAPGDSGGALVSADGALIGVITAKYRGAGAAGEPGFAVPVALVRRLIARATAQTEPQPSPPLTHLGGREPLGGAVVTALIPALAERYGADPAVAGVMIWDVGQGYAAQSGFSVGDVVIRVNDRPVASVDDLATLLASASGWRITIRRGGGDLTSVYGDTAKSR